MKKKKIRAEKASWSIEKQNEPRQIIGPLKHNTNRSLCQSISVEKSPEWFGAESRRFAKMIKLLLWMSFAFYFGVAVGEGGGGGSKATSEMKCEIRSQDVYGMRGIVYLHPCNSKVDLGVVIKLSTQNLSPRCPVAVYMSELFQWVGHAHTG